jgi:hypothetical protein
MKKSLIYLLFFISFSINAQTHILHFSDGSTKTGSTKRGNKKLKLRETKKGKWQEIDLSTLDYAESIYKNGDTILWTYVSLKEGKNPQLLDIGYLGEKIRSYEVSISSGGSGKVSNKVGVGVSASITRVFVKRNNENYVTVLRSGTLFGKSFEDRASTYFKDCKVLVSKLGEEGFEKGDVDSVIEYYDNNCVE